MTRAATCIFLIIAFVLPSRLLAQDFNGYVLKSVEYLRQNHAGGGYDLNKSYTHDLEYGDVGIIRATAPPATMCVAAIVEILTYAMKIHARETGETNVFQAIPLSAWTRGTPLSLKANIFMFAGTGSRGTGHTLAEFGLGEELRFADLKPGDFVNFNRTNRSGHAVVFLGYLKRDLTVSSELTGDVVGFRYFSAQGKGKADAGFAYRDAFFDGFCPSGSTMPRDCGVIRSNNRVILNAGRMWAPQRWSYAVALERKRLQTRSILEDQFPAETRGAIDGLLETELNRELNWAPEQATLFDGATTD